MQPRDALSAIVAAFDRGLFAARLDSGLKLVDDARTALASAPAAPDAHEVWVAAQLVPGEGIEDGVARIEALLGAAAAPAAEPVPPPGKVLVPMHMTAEMRRVFHQDDGCTWADLLAAADAVTEDEFYEVERLDHDPVDSNVQAQVVAPDAARLDWLLRHLPGDALRYCVGELSDTADEAEFRAAIDAARSSKAHGGAA